MKFVGCELILFHMELPVLDSEKEKIMHVALPIGGATVLMGSDTAGEHVAGFTKGNNFSLAIAAEKKEESDRIFTSLSPGGKVVMPMGTAPWGAYFGMLIDQFGIQWMVSFENKQEKK